MILNNFICFLQPLVRQREMTQNPLTEKLLKSGKLKPGHYALDLKEDDLFLPVLEYFLGLQNVDGFDYKMNDFLNKPINNRNTNIGGIHWQSICAELVAIYLLGKELELAIVGFDQTSPAAIRKGSDCDIIASVNGKHTFFEVKRNSQSESQYLPDSFRETLDNFESPFVLAAQLVKRDYNCDNLPSLLENLKLHVDKFGRQLGRSFVENNEDVLPFYEDSDIVVRFLDEKYERGFHYLDPPIIENISSFLLISDRIGRDGEPMKPKVKEAEEKGADYLICRVPSHDSLNAIVECCFEKIVDSSGKLTYYIEDSRIENLCGIILFHRFDRFCIINNINADIKNWISA